MVKGYKKPKLTCIPQPLTAHFGFVGLIEGETSKSRYCLTEILEEDFFSHSNRWLAWWEQVKELVMSATQRTGLGQDKH